LVVAVRRCCPSCPSVCPSRAGTRRRSGPFFSTEPGRMAKWTWPSTLPGARPARPSRRQRQTGGITHARSSRSARAVRVAETEVGEAPRRVPGAPGVTDRRSGRGHGAIRRSETRHTRTASCHRRRRRVSRSTRSDPLASARSTRSHGGRR